MKPGMIYIRQIIITVFLLNCYQNNVFSQGTDSISSKRPGFFIGISFEPTQSQIFNEGTLSVSELLSSKRKSFFGTMEFGFLFTKYIGLSSGIGINSYKSQLILAAYQNNFNSIDSENESYEMRVSGSNIQEEQTINFLSIPLCLYLRIPFNETFGLFLKTGVNLAVPINNHYKSSGTFTYKGYYPAYNILLENIPVYGFVNDKSIVSVGSMNLKPLDFNTIASAGFDIYIVKKIQIAVAASYSKSLLNKSSSSISDYSSLEKFQLSTGADHINSFMGGSSKVTTQSMGLDITLKFYL